jgi:hypothetical protein
MHPSMKRIYDDVATFGWHVVAISPDAQSPEFAFTIGLFRTFAHPEMVVFGLPMKVAHGVLTTCVQRIKEGLRFEAGQVRDDILNNHRATFLDVATRFYPEYLGSAIGFYDGLDFPVLQLVWPDKNDQFPWDPACDPAFIGTQAILSATDA